MNGPVAERSDVDLPAQLSRKPLEEWAVGINERFEVIEGR